MCTSFITNRNKILVGWNLDILDMEHRVTVADQGVYIEINDATEGWMPLFGANNRGDFVGMPTCWPADARSNPTGQEPNIINLDIDLLLQNKTLEDIHRIAQQNPICSVPGLTFMSQLTDSLGNALQLIPGQGYRYFEKPRYQVMTNFSPFKMNTEEHPWMGWDRYQTATRMLEEAADDMDVEDCFEILKATAQTVCPTVVSMVYDVTERTIHWCENRQWQDRQSVHFL